jgi:hypothetical protein
MLAASAFEAPGKICAGIANLQLLQILFLAQVVSLVLQWLKVAKTNGQIMTQFASAPSKAQKAQYHRCLARYAYIVA